MSIIAIAVNTNTPQYSIPDYLPKTVNIDNNISFFQDMHDIIFNPGNNYKLLQYFVNKHKLVCDKITDDYYFYEHTLDDKLSINIMLLANNYFYSVYAGDFHAHEIYFNTPDTVNHQKNIFIKHDYIFSTIYNSDVYFVNWNETSPLLESYRLKFYNMYASKNIQDMIHSFQGKRINEYYSTNYNDDIVTIFNSDSNNKFQIKN